MTLDYWFLFPISIAIATLAMASGIGGAVFFSPIFLLWLKLEPTTAVGTALLTELFGFGSGVVAYVRSKRIDYRLGASLLVFSVPGAVVGVLLADQVPPVVVKSVFAAGLLMLGYQMYSSWRSEDRERLDEEIATEAGPAGTRIVDRDGHVFTYTIRNKTMGRVFAAVGGMFLGMVSVGLAELEEYELVSRCRVPSPVAVATSIFVVVCTVLVAITAHGYTFLLESDPARMRQVASIAVFTAPGVLIGGQIGPRVGAKLDPDKLKVVISAVFMAVGLFMLTTLAL